MKRELDSLEDIKLLVDRFYDKIRNDQLLGPIFDGVIDGRWPEHLEKMYTFWQTVLLREHTYNGSPFSPHAKLPVEGKGLSNNKYPFLGAVILDLDQA